MVGNLPVIAWNPEWELGIKIIDEQHKKLVRMIANLQAKVQSAGDGAVDARLLHELLEYALTHFGDEERLFSGRGWVGEDDHKREHAAFLIKARNEMIRFQTGTPDTQMALLEWLYDWLREHIGFADREHGAFLKARGVV